MLYSQVFPATPMLQGLAIKRKSTATGLMFSDAGTPHRKTKAVGTCSAQALLRPPLWSPALLAQHATIPRSLPAAPHLWPHPPRPAACPPRSRGRGLHVDPGAPGGGVRKSESMICPLKPELSRETRGERW